MEAVAETQKNGLEMSNDKDLVGHKKFTVCNSQFAINCQESTDKVRVRSITHQVII